jgi:hypothetical protein
VPSTDLLRVARAKMRPPTLGSWRASAQDGAHIAPGLVDRRGGVHIALGQSPAYDILERLAVALAERRTLGLAVVGKHHEAIGARGLSRRALEPGQLPIVALQHRQGVGLANPRMMGHLVVAHEGRVGDRHALDDVSQQQGCHDVAHHHRDRGPDQRI